MIATCASKHDIVYAEVNNILNKLAIENNVSDVNEIFGQALAFIENHHDSPITKRHKC